MKRKSLILGIIVAVAVLTACGEKAPQGAHGREPDRKAPAAAQVQKEATPSVPPHEGTTPQAGQQEPPAAGNVAAPAEPASSSGPGVDPKTGQKYLYKTDTYMVLSENPTVIQAIPKKPTPGELEAWRKERESVPLVTEVMTEEELRAYMKEKNIPIITKENFKPPELVWGRGFEGDVATISSVSDLTDRMNSIVFTGQDTDMKNSIYFLDGKGRERKRMDFDNTPDGGNPDKEYCGFEVAEGGYGVAVVCSKETKDPYIRQDNSLAYYDQEGIMKWDLQGIRLLDLDDIIISHNGKSIGLVEMNPAWDASRFDAGNLNIIKIIFFDANGRMTMQYEGFRCLDLGKFSGSGRYFAGLFWFQEDFDSWAYLTYFDLLEGKIVWQIPFSTEYGWGQAVYSEHDVLEISENGTFIAAANYEMSYADYKENVGLVDHDEIDVFNAAGKIISRSKSWKILLMKDDGKYATLNRKGHVIVSDIGCPKYIIDARCIFPLINIEFLVYLCTYTDLDGMIKDFGVFDIKATEIWRGFIGDSGTDRFTRNEKYLKGVGAKDGQEWVDIFRAPYVK